MYFSNFQHNGRCIFLVFFALICIGKSSTVDLHINDTKEFTKRGRVWTFDNTQRKVILKIPQSSAIDLDIGSKRSLVTGVLIV
jgi:hypothetical protein